MLEAQGLVEARVSDALANCISLKMFSLSTNVTPSVLHSESLAKTCQEHHT